MIKLQITKLQTPNFVIWPLSLDFDLLEYTITRKLSSMFRGISVIQLFLMFLLLNVVLSGHIPTLISTFISDPAIGLFTLIGLISGITIHEASHAFVAYRLGDPTAKLQGRLTLNPAAHLDPLGTIAIIFLGFGWGKPTPFDPFNLRNIKRDSALISVAGAASNILLAIALCIPYLIAYYFQMLNLSINTIYYYITPVIFFNIILAVFNLLPIAPLDGFKVLAGLLPRTWYEDFIQTEQYGIFILLILLATGMISRILLPITAIIFSALMPGFAAGF